MEFINDLRDRIERAELLPGERLSATALAAAAGCDVAVVQEALERIVLEDLARYYPGRGVFVAEISVPETIELFQVFEVLESACARFAAEGVRAGKPAMRLLALGDQMRLLGEHPNADAHANFYTVSSAVKREILALAGNHALEVARDAVLRQGERAARLVSSGAARVAAGAQSYAVIIDAIVGGDATAAASAMAAHVRAESDWLVAVLSQSPTSDGRG